MHGSVDSEVGLLLDHVFCNRLAESLTYAGPNWLLVGLVSTYFLQQFDQTLDSCWTMLESCWTRLDLCFATVLRRIYLCWTKLASSCTGFDLFFAAVWSNVGLLLDHVGLMLDSFGPIFCSSFAKSWTCVERSWTLAVIVLACFLQGKLRIEANNPFRTL